MTTKESAANGLHGKVVQIAPPVADRVSELEAGQARIEALLGQLVGKGAPSKASKATKADNTPAKLSQTAGNGAYSCTYDKPSKRGNWHIFRSAEGADVIANVYLPVSANPKARKVRVIVE